MDMKSDSFRQELIRRVESFLIEYRPYIFSLIERYSHLHIQEWDDVYQDVAYYLINKVPDDYQFDNFDGLKTYCKKLAYWRVLYYKRTIKHDNIPLNGDISSNDFEELIQCFDTVDYLRAFVKTERELDVLRLLAQHYKRKDIAKELGISVERVRRICLKFQKYLNKDN